MQVAPINIIVGSHVWVEDSEVSSTQYASRLLPTYEVYEIYFQPGKVLYFKG